MASRLRLVTINPDDTTGDRLGAAVRDGDTITFEGAPVAEETFRTLSRRAGGDIKAWDFIIADGGWSNGYLMFVPDEGSKE